MRKVNIDKEEKGVSNSKENNQSNSLDNNNNNSQEEIINLNYNNSREEININSNNLGKEISLYYHNKEEQNLSSNNINNEEEFIINNINNDNSNNIINYNSRYAVNNFGMEELNYENGIRHNEGSELSNQNFYSNSEKRSESSQQVGEKDVPNKIVKIKDQNNNSNSKNIYSMDWPISSISKKSKEKPKSERLISFNFFSSSKYIYFFILLFFI